MIFSNFVSESCPATTLDLGRAHMGLVTFSRPSREQYPIEWWIISSYNNLYVQLCTASSIGTGFHGTVGKEQGLGFGHHYMNLSYYKLDRGACSEKQMLTYQNSKYKIQQIQVDWYSGLSMLFNAQCKNQVYHWKAVV